MHFIYIHIHITFIILFSYLFIYFFTYLLIYLLIYLTLSFSFDFGQYMNPTAICFTYCVLSFFIKTKTFNILNELN